MKRILSCAVALALVLVTMSAFALVASADATPSISVTLDNKSADYPAVDSTFEVVVSYNGVPTTESEEDYSGVGITVVSFVLDMPGYGTIYTKNGKSYKVDTLGTATGSAATFNIDGTRAYYAWAPTPTSEAAYRVGNGQEVLRLKMKVTTEPSSDTAITLSSDATETFIEAKEYNSSDAIVSNLSYSGSGLTKTNNAKVYEASSEPSVNTFSATTTLGNSGEAVHSANIGGVESGSAFRIAFTRPAGATSDDAIFGVTADAVRKYSPKQIGILAGLSGDIQMDVSFLNGRDGSIDSKTVTAVSVILANAAGTEFFFSDAEDASNKE